MPATSTAPTIATYFTGCLNRAINYGKLLSADIPPAKFAHMPHPKMNHPAWCFGHLSLYPNRVFTVLGRTELIVPNDKFAELFQANTECVEQDGRYPVKDEILAYYFERYNAAMKVLPTIPDEVFARDNPLEGRLREIFPLVGTAVNFLLNNHHMTHLGQVSAWRRAVGLGPVM